MTDTGITTYFDQDYKGGAITAVFIWFFMTIQPGLTSLIVKPYTVCYDSKRVCYVPGAYGYDRNRFGNYFSKAHNHAVAVLNIGATMIFGLLFFSLFSWIQTDNRIMQKVYYRFIAWLIPLSWILAVWVMTAAIWAASTKTDMFKWSEAT